MGWFSDLFANDPECIHGRTTMQPDKPWPRSRSTVEKDISEPVLAIVKAMKEHPSRFKTKVENIIEGYGYYREIKVLDLKTKQECIVGYSRYFVTYSPTAESYIWSWKWLTADEKELLMQTHKEIRNIKSDRLYRIKKVRSDADNSVQRAAMKAIYK